MVSHYQRLKQTPPIRRMVYHGVMVIHDDLDMAMVAMVAMAPTSRLSLYAPPKKPGVYN